MYYAEGDFEFDCEAEDELNVADKPDKVMDKLYISSYEAVQNKKLLQCLKISHIVNLTVKRSCFPTDFSYLSFNIVDCPTQDLIGILPASVEFIKKGIKEGTGVLVHCIAGTSRSAAVVIAYLMQTLSIPFAPALVKLKQARSCVSPNSGFTEQLNLWREMGFSLQGDSKAHRIYKLRSLAHKFCGKDAEPDDIPTFDDPVLHQTGTAGFQCRGCSRLLFLEDHLVGHQKGVGAVSLCSNSRLECDSYYVAPMSWMLGIHKMSGDIQCPSCFIVIGSWNWEPTKCSCLTSVTPAFKLDKFKVVAT